MIQQSATRATRIRARIAQATLLTVVLILGGRASGEDSVANSAPEPKTMRELIDSSKSWYDVYPSVEAKEPAKPLVALRWANNARGSEDGMTLLFVHEGLPLATACVYPWDKRLEYGFGSLSREKIVARRGGEIIWQPQQSGFKFADIPGAAAPADTRPARLRQMKSLVERFESSMLGWKADSTDREQLRLLTRPLFRYDPKAGEIVDGAVFAFATGTDPEPLLLIEAVRSGEESRWQYAFVRRTSGQLEGRLDRTVMWEADRFPRQHDPLLPYFTVGTPLPPEILAEELKLQEGKP